MNSYVASCCICFRTASCASGISASWPTGNAPLSCLFAFSCSARHRRPSKTPQALRTLTIFGGAPSALDRWSSSRDSRLPKCNFVLHRCSRLPHERTLYFGKTLRASPRSVVLRLIAKQISSSGFLRHSLHNLFSQYPASGRTMLSAALRRTVPMHLYACPSLHSICIGPASAATAAGFLQVDVSKARRSISRSSYSLADSRFRYITRTFQERKVSLCKKGSCPRCYGYLVELLQGYNHRH